MSVIVVTGASSGIGQATVEALAKEHTVIAVARRQERLEQLSQATGCEYVACDLADPNGAQQVRNAVAGRGITALIANAGGARGVDKVEDATDEQVIDRWQHMYDINVMTTLRTISTLLPDIRQTHGDIVVLTSMASRSPYAGGAGYAAAKHAQTVIPQTLRLELLGEPIRVIEIAPGLVHTEEFSLRRLGSQEAADAVYERVPDPLTASDVAEAIRWAISLPEHVNIDLIDIKPRAQASPWAVHRI